MPLWGSKDAASNSTIFAAAQVKVAPNTANRDALFGNTTANAFIAGVTVGQYGIDSNEIAAGGGSAAHTGWILRTAGQGGRAGRVQEEVLVAGGMSTDPDAEDTAYPDYAIRVKTQPSNLTIDATSNADNTGVMTIVATTVPTGGSISYLWVANTGSGFVNAASGTTGNTTATLTIQANSFTTGDQFRVVMSVSGGASVNSAVRTVTINT
jgi:hypothetical protein